MNKPPTRRPRLTVFRYKASIALLAILACACGVRPRSWGAVIVAAGQPIVIGVATDSGLASAPNPSTTLEHLQVLASGAGAIHGHPVQLEPFAVQCEATNPAAIVPEPEGLASLTGVIGPACSRGCVYAEGVLYATRTTMIAPACTAAAVVQQGFPIVFRLAWDDDDQGVVAARYLVRTLHVRRALIVRDTSVFSRALTTAFARSFKSLGGSTAELELSATGSPDLAALVSRASRAGSDGIFVATDRADAAELFSTLARAFPNTPVVGTDAVLGAPACRLGDESTEDVSRTLPLEQLPTLTCLSLSGAASTFLTAGLGREGDVWQSELRHPTASDLFWEQEADALQIYVSALAKVASVQADGSLRVPREGLRDAISRSQFTGTSGRIAFDAFGERRHDVGAALYRIGPGGVDLVSSLHR